MRFKSPLIAISAVGMLALSACGGSGSSSSPAAGSNGSNSGNFGDTGNGQDPNATGPVTIDGAQKGGTVNVLTTAGLSTTIDPSEIYYTDVDAITQGLMFRSLTQYRYDASTKQMVLVPDLATDLGKHNDNFTQWKFTIRPGVKWENGDPVTAKQVAWGMTRCMDATTFPTGPCQYYSNVYYKGGSSYKGPYTDPKTTYKGIQVNGSTITINMDKPFPDMPYWGAFPENGPVPLGNASNPKTYKNHPLSTGPYKISKYSIAKQLVLVRNTHWDPKTDPARTQYPDGYNFQSQVQTEKIDQILIADTGSGQTSLNINEDLLAPDYQKMKQTAPDRLVTGGQPCTFYWAPDNRKITDIKVRQALAWAYPYKNVILATGLIPGVNAVPASNLMPPGLPGRKPYNVLNHGDFQTDPAKAKALLKQAGALGYEIKFLFKTDDPLSVKSKDAVVRALTEAGFKATPVPTTVADYSVARDNTKEDINVRSAGWCSDWPSGSTWIPTIYGGTNPTKTGSFGTNYSAIDIPSVNNQIDAVQKLPLAQQAAAWNNMDKSIAQKYFPLFPLYYGGIALAHGSKIQGFNDDTTLGMPTYKDMWVSQ